MTLGWRLSVWLESEAKVAGGFGSGELAAWPPTLYPLWITGSFTFHSLSSPLIKMGLDLVT